MFPHLVFLSTDDEHYFFKSANMPDNRMVEYCSQWPNFSDESVESMESMQAFPVSLKWSVVCFYTESNTAFVADFVLKVSCQSHSYE